MPTKFSQFNNGGAIIAGDIVVGLRNGQNFQFNAPALPIVPWTELLVGQQLAVDNGYIMFNAAPANFLLPAVAAVGQPIYIISNTGVGFSITQNAGQFIQFGDVTTTVGIGGSISSTQFGDSIALLCIVANTTFALVGGAQGIWNIV